MPVTRPSKEQVRAYMQLRECDRRPPPKPEEIRRHLGWHDAAASSAIISAPSVLLPGAMAQLATLLAVEWCFIVSGVHRS